MPPTYDVAVVGAGVVGAAVARELAGYRLACVLLEAGPDVGAGTSKANTALLHTGFDAKPDTLEARLVRRGHELMREQGPALGIPIEPVGALLVAWSEEQVAALPVIAERAAINGWSDVRPVTVEELYRREPHLGPGAYGALEVPGEGIVCPFTAPLAFATEHPNYQVAVHAEERYACAGGIRSTGLSASLAIAEYLVAGLGTAGLPLEPKARVERIRMPNLGESFPRPYRSPEAVSANPDHGRIVCHCERVTRGELLDAAKSLIPPSDLDGLRRRTRALMGRCQGFYCIATVAALLADATGQTTAEVLGVPGA